MVSVSNLYELAHWSYGSFSTDMQKQGKSLYDDMHLESGPQKPLCCVYEI